MAVSAKTADEREQFDRRAFSNVESMSDKADKGYQFEFRNVSFKYPGQENYALRNVSMTFQAGQRPAVFISHRLSSCRFCHDIAVFHEGRLVQRSSHDVLVSDKSGMYYSLWNAQAQYYEVENLSLQSKNLQ